MKQQYFLLALFLYIVAVLFLAATTPLSAHEAKIFFTSGDTVGFLMRLGNNLIPCFFGSRLFFLLLGFGTIGLFYLLSKHYFKQQEDVYLSTAVFMFLPGMLTAGVLVNVSILVLPLVLLFVILHEKGHFYPLLLIMSALFYIHETSMIFFIALLIYGVMHRDKKLAFSSLLFLVAFFYFSRGLEIGGRPSGHFAEIFGLYATIFSPLLFLYFFYAMYRTLLKGEKTLLWTISFTALVFSLLLSIRQRVYIPDFAPYVMIAIVMMLDVFNHSVRVRLPQFQKIYQRGFGLVIFFMGATVLAMVFHQVTYHATPSPHEHFAHRVYAPYELAKKLKEEGKNCYEKQYNGYHYQLQFYDILPCEKP